MTTRLVILLLLTSLWLHFPAQAAPARLLQEISLQHNQIIGLTLSSDGKTLAYSESKDADDSGTLYLRDARAESKRVAVSNYVHDFALSSDGRLLAYIYFYFAPSHRTEDCFWTLTLYDVHLRKRLRFVVLPDDASFGLGGIAFSADGSTVACGSYPVDSPCGVRLYRTQDLTLKSKLVARIPLPYNIAFSDDGRYLAAATSSLPGAVGNTAVWSVGDRRLRQVFDDDGPVFFAPDQHTLIFLFHAKAETGPSLRPIKRAGKDRFLFCRTDVHGFTRGPLELWSLKPRKRLRRWFGTGSTDFSDSCGLSSDGRTLAGIYLDNGWESIRVWRLN